MQSRHIITVCLIFLLLFSTVEAVNPHMDDKVGEDTEGDTLHISNNRGIYSEPDTPSDPIPFDGEVGLNGTPILSVVVNHPEGFDMDVSFYNNDTDSIVGTVENVSSGERAEMTWENRDPATNYSWHVIADDGENQTEGGPWNFTTAGVDYIEITDEINGTALEDRDVPPNFEQWGNLSTYNNTYGFFDNPGGEWSVSGDAELLTADQLGYNGINVGETAGYVWFNVSSDLYGLNDSVRYNVITDEPDYIEITDSPGGDPIQDETVDIGYQKRGYCSVYNESTGYLYTVEGNWSAEGGSSYLLEDGTNESNVIDVGHEGGTIWFNLSYDGLTDSVRYDVLSPEPDDIVITYDPDGDSIIGGEVPVGFKVWGNASGYNQTSGYIGTVEVEWSVEHEEGMSPSLGPSPSDSSWIDVGNSSGEMTWKAAYQRGNNWVNDTVEFIVQPPEIDYIEVTKEGDTYQGGSVSVNHTVDLEISAYNETSGHIGFIHGEWAVEGGNATLLNGTTASENTINVGTIPGEVILTVQYEDFSDEVMFEVKDPQIDYIKIIEDPYDPVSMLNSSTIYAGEELVGYSAGYNDTVGFVDLVDSNWYVENYEGAQAETSPSSGNSSVFYAGDSGGEANWIAEYTQSINYTVEVNIRPPTIDEIQIRDEPGGNGEILKNITLGKDENLSLYSAGYNDTFGYQRDVECEWFSSDEDVGYLDESYGETTEFFSVSTGVVTINVLYGSIQKSTTIEVVDYRTPEIDGTIPDIELEKDFGIHEIDLSDYASDEQDSLSELEWYLTGYSSTVISVYGENQTGNHNITLLSKENAVGSMEVRYWLVNSAGNTVSQTAWINITTAYQSPEIRRCPDLYVLYDEPYQFDYAPYIIYDEGRFDELVLETDDEDHTTVDGLKVTYEYPQSMLGEEVLVTITVSDGENSVSTVISVTVTSNTPPVGVENLPDLTINQGETLENVFNLDDYFEDPEGDPLYMSYGYTYLTITIHDDHTVDVRADGNWHGVEKVTFRAKDPVGGIVEQTINVTVLPVNYPPEIKELPPLVVRYNEPYEFDLEYYINDPDNETQELTITTDSPEYVTVIGTKLIMNYPRELNGLEVNYTVPLQVHISDGIDNASEVTTVKVGTYYPPELVIPLHDITFKENERMVNAFNLDNHFIDQQNDTMYYSSGNENIKVDIHENSSVDFYAPENWNGQELITIRATNSAGALMEDSLIVTVIPVNNPPTISDLPMQEGEVGQSWIFDMGDYISDVDNETHELEIIVEDPNVDVFGHKILFDYNETGDYNVTIRVSDGLDTTENHVEVIVRESEDDSSEINSLFFLLGLIPLGLIGVVLYIKKGNYTIEDVFLIHDSGVLIKHITRTLKAERDEDILAGMFTAVQNFVDDAFADDDSESLKKMEYGNKKVLVHKGENVILAVFISGEEPKWTLEGMKNLVSDIEERYGVSIEKYSGDLSELEGIEDMLTALHKGRGKYREGDWKKYD
ncbi:MAG: Ig-like domain-containing protein [Candidatus Saliniplasma sp.]